MQSAIKNREIATATRMVDTLKCIRINCSLRYEVLSLNNLASVSLLFRCV